MTARPNIVPSDTLLALAERCEQATGPDRELDRLIHEQLFGTSMATFPSGKIGGPFYLTPDGRGMNAPFAFTGHVEDAEYALPDDGDSVFPEWQITRRMPTGYHANVCTGDDGGGLRNPRPRTLRRRSPREGRTMKHAPIVKRSLLDELYADAPKPRERFLWPVCSDPFTMKPIRWFDSWGEAADFVSANLGKVNLFVGEPKRRSA